MVATENGPAVAAGREGPGSSVTAICVCACTYRRPEGLAALLEGLGRQEFSLLPRPAMHIVIADNEGSPEARAICEEFRKQFGIPLTYVHEPQRGISFARNACLDHVPPECEFFTFIDDDEVPEPDWLERLMEAQQATDADVVQGSVTPVFHEGAPRWLVEGDFFGWPRRNWRGTRMDLQEHQELPEAYTNNVLVRKSSVTDIGLRFDPKFALTGGGDTMFFRGLKSAGARIVFTPRARVTEKVPAERATLWYRLKLEYRIANNRLPPYHMERRKRKIHRRIRQLWRGSGVEKIVLGVVGLGTTAIAGRMTQDAAIVAALQCAYGLGQCARALGFSYRPYR